MIGKWSLDSFVVYSVDRKAGPAIRKGQEQPTFVNDWSIRFRDGNPTRVGNRVHFTETGFSMCVSPVLEPCEDLRFGGTVQCTQFTEYMRLFFHLRTRHLSLSMTLGPRLETG